MSIRILDDIVEALRDVFLDEKLDIINGTEDGQDLIFIKELILGHPLNNNGTFEGRGPEKKFLYQV